MFPHLMVLVQGWSGARGGGEVEGGAIVTNVRYHGRFQFEEDRGAFYRYNEDLEIPKKGYF